jgi:hypothetical protein
MSSLEDYKEKLTKYRETLHEFHAQIANHNFTRLVINGKSTSRNPCDPITLSELRLRSECAYPSIESVRILSQRVQEDRCFLSNIYDSIQSTKILLENEPDPIETIEFDKIVGDIVVGVLGAFIAGAGSQQKVYVKGYRRKDGTYVKSHYKTIHTARSVLNNSNISEDTAVSEKESLHREKERLILEYDKLMEKINNRILTIINTLREAESYIKDPILFKQKTLEVKKRLEENKIDNDNTELGCFFIVLLAVFFVIFYLYKTGLLYQIALLFGALFCILIYVSLGLFVLWILCILITGGSNGSN